MHPIRIGIGGWNFAPWRGTFYPSKLPQAQELAFASRQLHTIEINSTFYGSQKPESFRKWAEQTPPDFVFSVKGPRFATNRRDLTEAHVSIERFLNSGVMALGPKLGPILWQFPGTRVFDADALRPFLAGLPRTHEEQPLQHVIETQHPSFVDASWIALLREFGVAAAMIESDKHAMIADASAPFLYLRLERNSASATEGYDSGALDLWEARLRRWASGKPVKDLATSVAPEAKPPARPCFVYFISGDKQRAPDSARAMMRRFGQSGSEQP